MDVHDGQGYINRRQKFFLFLSCLIKRVICAPTLGWVYRSGAAACLILCLRCKNRAKAHKFNPKNFKIMTASVQTSFFPSLENADNISRKARRSNRPQLRLFQVDVENFDNEVESYEIEAHNRAEAADIAQSRFGGEAYNMNIYDVCEF